MAGAGLQQNFLRRDLPHTCCVAGAVLGRESFRNDLLTLVVSHHTCCVAGAGLGRERLRDDLLKLVAWPARGCRNRVCEVISSHFLRGGRGGAAEEFVT